MASAVVLGLSLKPGPLRCLQPTTPVDRCLRRGFESRRKVWAALGPPGIADGRFSTLTFVSARERPQRVMRAVASPRAHWRTGTSDAPNVLDSDPTAVTDLISFLRTIDDSTAPFPAADLTPNDPAFVDAAAQCDCQKDPPPSAHRRSTAACEWRC